ncbi:MAG: beta-galactosidase [Armatimonadetes bacterium]|nr:beta-galactosidase [Armatimonadota bacterium]
MSDRWIAWDRILYGGDYNPDQWPEEVWREDARLMRLAHWNTATVPVFSWARLEPEEGRFDFGWLDRVVETLESQGIGLCLATSTASQPAWVDAKYPDVLITDPDGVRRRHGNRHSFCPNSANYRRLSVALASRLAERYGRRPSLRLWHVNNEYGTICFCENCAAAFRRWLQKRYGTLEELNRRWYTAFWGHTYTDWGQIEPPYRNGEGSIQALRIDYHRFQSESLLRCFQAERDAIRRHSPDVPITTNLMGTFFNLNYHQWAKELDVVSWDNYPWPEAKPEDVAFYHALHRGMKDGQPFLLMEQSPSQQNWQPYNKLKSPGRLRLQSFQTVAHGADSVMYFQWRRGRGGCEKLHGAAVEHGGGETNRVFREVAEIGAELESLGTETIGGRTPARVAVVFSWESWWAIRYSSGPSRDLDYPAVVRAFYAALHRLGIAADVVGADASFERYDVILLPLLTMVPRELGERLEARVREGATLVATPFTGLVDETDLVHPEGSPGPLSEVLGVFVEETDAMLPGEENAVRFADGDRAEARLLCDRIRLRGAEPIGFYERAFYAGEPAVTRNPCSKGVGYYLATYLGDEGLRRFVKRVCAERGIASPLAGGAEPPEGVEVAQRVQPDGAVLTYLLNHTDEERAVALPAAGTDLLTRLPVGPEVRLAPRDVRIVRS